MKNILVFTYGDSSNPSTWSNVPYLLTKTFEKKGYNIIRVDISTKRNIITLAYNLFMKLLKPSTTFYFVRSKINRRIVEKKIKKAVEKYDQIVDLYICIGFDFSPSSFTKKKVLLLSDWPIEYAIETRYNREPDWLEKKDIERHKVVIENANYRVSLFKDISEYMNNRFLKKTECFGCPINSFFPINGFEKLTNRNKITFIGKKSYYASAKSIIKAFQTLDSDMIKKHNLELHIIGMTKNDFLGFDTKNVYFHGYLDKGKKKQREEYYKILKETLVVVNTSENWAGMSSILEAMYYYRPIITSRYQAFEKNFGKKINFGYYSKNSKDEISNNIKRIVNLSTEDYQKMIESAHDAVKEYTYDKYIDNLVELTK